jgi:uncharacterized protein (DUF433 family)
MGRVPCIRGTRIPVATVVGVVADGMTTEEIRSDFPQLSTEEFQEALRYGALAVDERKLPLRSPPQGSSLGRQAQDFVVRILRDGTEAMAIAISVDRGSRSDHPLRAAAPYLRPAGDRAARLQLVAGLGRFSHGPTTAPERISRVNALVRAPVA